MADEAYRPVFLRVHPTGKMVLSLTTEADGNEARYAELVAAGARVPPLDVKVVPADETASGRPRVQHEPVPRHAARRSPAPRARSGPRRSCIAGVALESTAGRACAGRTARSSADAGRRRRSPTSPLYAHGSGELPPGVEGGWTRRLSTATDAGVRPSRRTVHASPRTGRARRRQAGHTVEIEVQPQWQAVGRRSGTRRRPRRASLKVVRAAAGGVTSARR